ncbi:hypothetical protein PLESTB_001355500 [Pleodorina starrii]|uniref:OTU domain-containing protein n=1 Tax=Pleodorina starrii TaxID=330485 RepID=A0A9W6F6S6_9CHLO|nr:hypothetical protein PLESTM_001915300 [Pleodorina starrii]GLC58408.1 hypothetical protein PLESTB_001355500 [Pleodorina starrii]GLC76471.1 hypothetical protein PLESTF_001784900 [Pleodorina starrii]
MGRKGMKGFLKGAHKQRGSDDEDAEAPAQQPSTSAPKPAAAATAPCAPAATQPATAAPPEKPAGGDDDDSGDDEGDSKGPETRGKMLQRHKREMVAHKKAMQKLGAKKKDEAAKLTAEIEARHARELVELEERDKQQQQQQAAAAAVAAAGGAASASAAGQETDGAADQLSGLGLGAGAGHAAEHKKPSKAQKRREKLAQQDAEREARIASEQAAMGPSDKAVEEQALQAMLLPLRLGIREIRADGHCLYRSVEDQLSQAAAAASPVAGGTGGSGGTDGSGVPDHQALRRLAAAHIRSHSDDFLPFIYEEDSPGDPSQQLEAYCAELEGSAVWGGQLELGALAQALKKQIKVYAAGLPTVSLGDEHAASGGVLQLCYLRHAFGLGEHYNSVVPLGAGAGAGSGQDG